MDFAMLLAQRQQKRVLLYSYACHVTSKKQLKAHAIGENIPAIITILKR